MKKVFLGILTLVFLFLLTQNSVKAQSVSISYKYSLRTEEAITEAPQISEMPDFDYSEQARKNGVEGVSKLSMILAEDGQVKDIQATEWLPFGVTEEIIGALKKWTFEPAKNNGKPVKTKLELECTIALVFADKDPNVKKAQVLQKPLPTYPEKYRAEKVKGAVEVFLLVLADGTIRINNVSSTLPKEFDKAVEEVIPLLKIQPAVHKKSGKPVNQEMYVLYEFKP